MSLETEWESPAQAGAEDELFGIIEVDILKPGMPLLISAP
jgi:hypothetical protein